MVGSVGAGALLSFGITAPIGAAGGNEARRLAVVRGLRAPDRTLQVVSWVGYGYRRQTHPHHQTENDAAWRTSFH